MVDPGQLAFDTVGNFVALALPAILWLFLYRFVWDQGKVATDIGFTRLCFWLLLLGGVLATIADLPILGLEGNVLAVNLGGGLFPIIISVLVLHRAFRDDGRPLSLFFAGLVAGVGAGFILLIVLGDSPLTPLAMALALIVPALVILAGPGIGKSNPTLGLSAERASFTLVLTVGAILLTFLTTAAIANVGIVSTFPLYLVAPIVVGIIAVLAARPLFHLPPRFGLTIGYAAATFGVLLGADLYRQPPLYGTSGNIYAIGGAGALDLVALSGPLAMAAAFLVYWLLRAEDPAVEGPSPREVPAHVANQAVDAYLAHQAGRSIQLAASAARASGEQGRRLLFGEPSDPLGRPWLRLPVPAWVEGDQQNLEALARSGTEHPYEAYRAVQTARLLTRIGREVARARFAAVGQRALAFVIDLLFVTAFGALSWVLIAEYVGATNVLTSVAFNTAVLGFSSFAFLYFAVLETLGGITLGKWLLRLSVTDRQLRAPSLLEALVRNVPKLVPLTIIGYGGAIATAYLLGAGAAGSGASVAAENLFLGIVVALLAVAGVALCGLVGVGVILTTDEHQRLGDYLAGTWVVRTERRPTPPMGVPLAAAAGPSG